MDDFGEREITCEVVLMQLCIMAVASRRRWVREGMRARRREGERAKGERGQGGRKEGRNGMTAP